MIRIQNIYYMLSYAFQILRERGYKEIATEEFENVGELCAEILINGVTAQIKRGLRKEYITRSEPLSSLKGKIDISSSLKEQTMRKRQLVCSYDEFSVDSYLNAILKTTMEVLLRSDICFDRKRRLRKLLAYFSDVTTLPVRGINWHIQYNQNNQTYRMLISICYLVMQGLLQTTDRGSAKLMGFLDEQRMCRLYEKFILEYYRKEHPRFKAEAAQIPWALDDGYGDMLPAMQSDVTLRDGNNVLIIDAKCYAATTQTHYDAHTIHSENLYQIFTYVKNMNRSVKGTVSGMLLYARTDERILPDQEYRMDGNRIFVKTLDLDCDFSEIRAQLDQIAYNTFG